jgi:hypothetical protein
MEAYLYQIKLFSPGAEFPVEREFIVAGDDANRRDTAAQRMKAQHVENSKLSIESATLALPMRLNNRLVSERGDTEIDWFEAQQRVKKQQKNRPRGIGCIFRGSANERHDPYSAEELDELRASIEYFMDEHRTDGGPYLFVGSPWQLETRLRSGEVCIFEASGIELAADLVQLRFLTGYPLTTLTEWCASIFFV